jgi:UDP-N-acetylmuramoylalanine-D-glutamate ligase
MEDVMKVTILTGGLQKNIYINPLAELFSKPLWGLYIGKN